MVIEKRFEQLKNRIIENSLSDMLQTSFQDFVLENVFEKDKQLGRTLKSLSTPKNEEDFKALRQFAKENRNKLGRDLFEAVSEELRELYNDYTWANSDEGRRIIERERWVEAARERIEKDYPKEYICVGRSSKDPMQVIVCGYVDGEKSIEFFKNYFTEMKPCFELTFVLKDLNDEEKQRPLKTYYRMTTQVRGNELYPQADCIKGNPESVPPCFDYEPTEDLKFQLKSQAELTDVLTAEGISDMGLLISEKVKTILEKAQIMQHNYSNASVIKGNEEHKYFLLNFTLPNLVEDTDYKNSEFGGAEYLLDKYIRATDMFVLPLFSLDVYVSEDLKNALEENEVSGICFSDPIMI